MPVRDRRGIVMTCRDDRRGHREDARDPLEVRCATRTWSHRPGHRDRRDQDVIRSPRGLDPVTTRAWSHHDEEAIAARWGQGMITTTARDHRDEGSMTSRRLVEMIATRTRSRRGEGEGSSRWAPMIVATIDRDARDLFESVRDHPTGSSRSSRGMIAIMLGEHRRHLSRSWAPSLGMGAIISWDRRRHLLE